MLNEIESFPAYGCLLANRFIATAQRINFAAGFFACCTQRLIAIVQTLYAFEQRQATYKQRIPNTLMRASVKIYWHCVLLSLCLGSLLTAAQPLVNDPPAGAPSSALVTVNAASFAPRLAPGAIAALFGTKLAERAQVAATIPLPTDLEGVGVRLIDSHNTIFSAPLFFVSPGQINYLMPDQIALGEARIFVIRETELIAQGTLLIANSAPALFTFSSNGKGIPTALTTFDGENFASVTDGKGAWRTVEPSTDQRANFLLLFGTGFRHAKKLQVRIGNVELKPVYVGAQGVLAGLDQINLALPPDLPGGLVQLQIISDGYTSNLVQLQLAD